MHTDRLVKSRSSANVLYISTLRQKLCKSTGKYVHSVLGLFHHVDMGNVVDVPEIHAA